MKKIDKLLIKSFIPPFIVAFFIAMFVLTMQFLWLWLDDIIGKGIGLLLIFELLFYLMISFIPMSLPIGILISSVMVMGGLAERYELSSLKSAGVSLIRVMAPLVGLTSLIAVFCFFCANNFIPVANLQFRTRLFDINRQRPTFNIVPGTFNDAFAGYSIRIGKKSDDNKSISDIIVYENEPTGNRGLSVIKAKSGQMYTTEDKRTFVMELYNGEQYQQMPMDRTNTNAKIYPFMRTKFDSLSKAFDLSAFVFSRTDENVFKSQQAMLTSDQLAVAIDSINEKIGNILYDYKTTQKGLLLDTTLNRTLEKAFDPALAQKPVSVAPPASQTSKDSISTHSRTAVPSQRRDSNFIKKLKDIAARDRQYVNQDSLTLEVIKQNNQTTQFVQQSANINWDTITNFLSTFPADKRGQIRERAVNDARNQKSRADLSVRIIKGELESRAKHLYEMHTKFSVSLVCVLFLFLGAPMGAIVKKGGFGYPLLISIGFFVFYIFLTIFCKRLNESMSINPVLASWLPCIILIPLGAYLTYKAIKDATLFKVDRIANAIKVFVSKFSKKK